MDIKESITAAMDEVIKRSQVTLDGTNRPRNIDISLLSKEEKDFYLLMFGDDTAAVRHRRIHCTACDGHIGSAPSQFSNMFSHPVLLTLLCLKCRKFYGDGNFEQGEDATDMFCRWCANGGNLYCCSYCSNTFCNKCIKRNLDPLVRQKIEDEEKWKCFVCDPTDLYTARAVCRALLQHVQTVTWILKNDRTIREDDFKEKMNLDESKCCTKKRGKAKRRRYNTNGSEEEDETYHPSIEDLSLMSRRRSAKKSPRLSSMSNGGAEKEKQSSKLQSLVKPKTEIESSNDDEEDEEDLLPPMIPCVQSMVEGENSETLNQTLNSLPNFPGRNGRGIRPAQQTLHINPIPTANLLKIAPPPPLTLIQSSLASQNRKRTLQHILPAPNPGFLVVKNQSPKNPPQQSVHTIEYSGLPLRPPTKQPNVPMVAIPNTNTKSPTSRPHTIEYSSLPLRTPNLQPNRFKKALQARVLVHKPKPVASTSLHKDTRVIEIGSDSDEPEIEELVGDSPVGRSRDILKNMLNKTPQESPTFGESFMKRKGGDKSSNKVEEEIDTRTEEVRMLFKLIGTKLRKVPLLHLPNHNNLRSTRVKTRRFHLAISKAIASLSEINDKVVHKYSDWRKSMVDESRQTRSNDNTTNSKTMDDEAIPLDMICTNSESESDNNDGYESDAMFLADKVRCIKSFQERDTIDVAVGEPISTADKAVQAYDIVERDYEKCIGHSVLTKVEYDPVDGSEILKPVIVPAEYNGKFEEQFIFYLQHREENELQTDDDKGLPDPNETPLKDLIEANSPFVLEMLENIDSPSPNEITNELGGREKEVSDEESGKENEDQSEPTNVVKELAKIVTELSEDLKTSKNSETSSKKHTEHGKKDRRKQILESMGPEEVDIAVQTLIEEDERSRSSNNDDEIVSRSNSKEITIEGKNVPLGYNEDECTIIE